MNTNRDSVLARILKLLLIIEGIYCGWLIMYYLAAWVTLATQGRVVTSGTEASNYAIIPALVTVVFYICISTAREI